MKNSVILAAFSMTLAFAAGSNVGIASAQSTEAAIEKAKEIENQLQNSETIKEISAGILQPIYELAQYMSHPWFYWTAFAVMAAGVVSFALQLTLTKLALLFRLKLRLSEVFSDALGLLVSLTGLVVVTQAATQNSTFTQSSVSVVSAAAVGLLAGFIFYVWGQRTEMMAARDQKVVVQRDEPRNRM